ncbi:MAG: hypothetical protein WDN50_05620 [Bradyrhizobium sp.]
MPDIDHIRAEIERMRIHMQRERPTSTTLGCLIAAIDAYAEQLTGTKDALWAGTRDTKRWWDE